MAPRGCVFLDVSQHWKYIHPFYIADGTILKLGTPCTSTPVYVSKIRRHNFLAIILVWPLSRKKNYQKVRNTSTLQTTLCVYNSIQEGQHIEGSTPCVYHPQMWLLDGEIWYSVAVIRRRWICTARRRYSDLGSSVVGCKGYWK